MHLLLGEQVDILREDMRMIVRELGLLSEAYFDIGVTLAERHLLIELQSAPQLTVGEIAGRLLLEKSSASRLIAKAAKKGFVAYSPDAKDKRKRWLKITAKGRKTLAAFEPLAQKQVKEALETLNEKEVKLVYQGVALFAKGLAEARNRKNGEI